MLLTKEVLTNDMLHEGGQGTETGVHSIQEAAQDHDAGCSGHHTVLGGHRH